MNPIKQRRFGRFSVSKPLIERNEELFWALANADMVVLDARMDPCAYRIEYRAAWEEFDQLKPGEDIPEYNLIVKKGVLTAERVTG